MVCCSSVLVRLKWSKEPSCSILALSSLPKSQVLEPHGAVGSRHFIITRRTFTYTCMPALRDLQERSLARD